MSSDEKSSVPTLAPASISNMMDLEKSKPGLVPTNGTDSDDDTVREGSEIFIDPVLNQKVLRRLDIRFAPLFLVLYFMAYLDRANIGNAAVAGLKKDLNLTGAQFSTSVSVFYATYVAFMLPYVLALRWLKVHRAISLMAASWTIVTIGTAFVRNYEGLLAVRLILGACESGFFSCISLYITMVYNRQEQGLRFAYLYSAIALSGMFGGLVATGITKIHHYAGLNTWSWLYIVEGCISFLVVPWAWYGLPENPSKAKFWTPEERQTMELRDLKRQEYMGANQFSWTQVMDALKTWRLYTGALIQFCQDLILYGFSTFLPSILRNGLGYTQLQAQYLSVPVYLLGGITFFTASLVGDKWGLRGTALIVLNIFAVIGYAVLLSVKNSSIQYFAVYLIAFTLYAGVGLNETWIVSNTAPHYKRATALGFTQTIGNTAGVVAGQVYREAPYRLGHWASLISIIVAIVLAAVQIAYFKFENKKKEQIRSGQRPDDRPCTTGEYNLDFKYVY